MQNNWLFSTRMFFAPDDGNGGSAFPTSSVPSGGDSGGSSVPSVAPAGGGDASPPPAPDTGGTPPSTPTPDADANPWANLGSVDDLNFVEVPPEVPPTNPQAPVVPPVVAPAPTPQAAIPPVPPVQAAPQTQPEPQAQPVASPSPSDPVGIANAIEANRDAIIEHLATTKFALTPEEVSALETDVVTAVPRLMAKMFVESQTSMQKFLAQAMPGMMKNYNTVTRANDDAEGEFFKAHAALDKSNPQHRATAIRLATLYRSANPNIPLGQLIQEVGPMVIAAVGVNAGPRPANGSPAAPRATAPFRPAVGGGGAPPNPEPENPWAGMGQTFD